MPVIESARDAGFTTAVTFPMTNIFAGQGVIFDLAGERSGAMIVNPSAGMYLTHAQYAAASAAVSPARSWA